ncbi:MAG: hypothetical protein WBC20_09355, partial [Candidatus Aminicenantaceae bacterium]
MFSILTLFSLLVLISALFFHHYRRIRNLISKDSTDFKITNYFFWQVKRISGLFKTSIKKDCQKLLHKVLYLRYPTAEKWSIILLSLSFVLLAASGFIYALFTTKSLSGYPLLFHVCLGGVFAVCLSVVVVLQAPIYSFHKEVEFSKDTFEGREVIKPVTVKQKILFWLFVISGLLQALTALSLMLPVFSLTTQMSVVAI